MYRAQPKTVSVKQQILWPHLSSRSYGDILPKKTHFGSPISLKQEKIIKDSSVHFSWPPQTRPPSMRGKERKKSNEIVRSTNVDDQRMSLLRFNTFWFHYHFFFCLFSTVHLSFMEMAERHKNFESYFLRHYVSSNHFFQVFSFFLFSDVSYLFFFNGYGELTDAAPVTWHPSCRSEFLSGVSEDKWVCEWHELCI